MLSPVRWTNPSGGAWDTPGNWSTDKRPGAGDDVVIDTPGITVEHTSAASDAIHSLISQATIGRSGGSLSIAAPSTMTRLNPSFGTLTGAGALSVTGALNRTNGKMSGTGTTTAAEGSTLALPGDLKPDARTLANAGTATYSPNGYLLFTMGDSATIDNLEGGSFMIAAAVPFFTSGTAPEAFSNAGTLIHSRGTIGRSIFDGIAFNNAGSVQVQSGTLDLAGGGDSTGSFTVAAGATLSFSGGTQTLEAASQVGGAVTVHVQDGTFDIRANDLVRVMGQPDPPLTASYFGFVNGDGPSSLASPAVLTTTATAGRAPRLRASASRTDRMPRISS
jgi:hypothetical protein